MQKLKLNTLEQKLIFAMLVSTMFIMVIGKGASNYQIYLFYNVLLIVQATRKQTVGMSAKRIIGTLIGGALGLLFYQCFPLTPIMVLPFLFLAVTISYFFFDTYIGIVGVVGIMLLLGTNHAAPVNIVVGRIMGAVIGVFISILSVSIIMQNDYQSYKKFVRLAKANYTCFFDAAKQLILDEKIYPNIESKMIPQITDLRTKRYDLLDADNDITSRENKKMEKVISLFADCYMHMRIINRTGGDFSDENLLAINEKFDIEASCKRVRTFENTELLNIHAEKMLVTFKEIEQMILVEEHQQEQNAS